MSVYEANTRSLAEFISNTKLGFMPCGVKSTTGYRRDGSSYMISAHKIHCDRIYIVNDCFIDIEGNIVVASYIPAIKYILISNELSPCFNEGEHLGFEYRADSQVLRYEIEKDIKLRTYDDFENCIENLIRHIGQNIEKMINNFKGGSWSIDNVVCGIEWQVDRTLRK